VIAIGAAKLVDMVVGITDDNLRASPRQVPCNMPRDEKSARAAANLSFHVLMVSICFSASYLLDRRHGFLTAVMCFDSVIDEQRPFGTPKFSM